MSLLKCYGVMDRSIKMGPVFRREPPFDLPATGHGSAARLEGRYDAAMLTQRLNWCSSGRATEAQPA